jgi:CDP-6-deoxy-D-xylo-4-hexulose-3-dehydrase|tara:strand:+ start:2429 stop:3583 length:1155 start_codon:yes stop_codon:yes gene_type:complete
MTKLVSDTINRDDINALIEWLQQDPIPRLTKGDLTAELEEKWAKKIGTKYSVYVNSGSSAILLALAALNESNRLKNNRIVVPALSWATDVSSPMLLGLDPIMCDCNLHDLSCDLTALEFIFKQDNPAALILVSPLGLVPQMKEITNLCKKYNVILLEDVCESMGSKYNNKNLGSFGFASFFSMYFGHHLSTIEGGFINTNDEDFYHMLLMMRSHGWDRDLPKWKQDELRKEHNCNNFDALYNFYVPGFNLRATDLQAFIGLRAIDKLDNYVVKRTNNFNTYKSWITNNKLNLDNYTYNTISNFAMPIVHEQRDNIVKDLISANIEVRPLIAGNMASKPMWKKYACGESLPNAELIEKHGFYVPNHQDLTSQEISQITDIINSYE